MDSLEEQLRKISEQLQKDTKMSLSLPELFDDEFISHNSKFKNFQDLIDASGIEVKDADDFKLKENSGLFDQFIKQNTSFQTMNEMEESAAEAKVLKRLKEKGYSLG